jgi:hypothetical protein
LTIAVAITIVIIHFVFEITSGLIKQHIQFVGRRRLEGKPVRVLSVVTTQFMTYIVCIAEERRYVRGLFRI